MVWFVVFGNGMCFSSKGYLGFHLKPKTHNVSAICQPEQNFQRNLMFYIFMTQRDMFTGVTRSIMAMRVSLDIDGNVFGTVALASSLLNV